MKPFKRVESDNPDVKQLSDNVADYLSTLTRSEGVYVPSVVIGAGQTYELNHGLNRAYIDVFPMVPTSASSDVCAPAASNRDREKTKRTVVLYSVNGWKGGLWVF